MDMNAQFLEIVEEIDGLKETIASFRRKYEEGIDNSLRIHSYLSNKIKAESLKIILQSLTDDSFEVARISSYIENSKISLKMLHFFSLSEITHRKILGLKFKLANPFFFRKCKKEFRTMVFELEDLDREASQHAKEPDVAGITQRYDDLLRKIRFLKGELGEEKKSGLVNYIKWLIPGVSGWIAAISVLLSAYTEYLQPYFGIIVLFVLLVPFLIIPLLLLFWNFVFYGFKHNIQIKILFLVPLLLLLCLYILSPGIDFESLLPLLGVFAVTFCFIIISSLATFKTELLRKEIEGLEIKFFGSKQISTSTA